MKKDESIIKRSTRGIGSSGESIAEHFLTTKGYRIIERNYRTRFGEIDIIAGDGDIIAFVEVKLRRNARYGTGGEAIDRRKRMQVASVAKYFLAARKLQNAVCRFDTVLVSAGDTNERCTCQLIQDAFRLD